MTSPMRGFLSGFAAAGVLGCVAGYVLLQSGLIPANADAKPGAFELWAAGTSLSATLARQAPKGPNPVSLTDAHLVEGIRLYRQHCAICHGDSDGEASPVAQGLYPAPPQLGADGVEDDPEGFSFWKIKHGIRLTGMPSWGRSLTDEQIWTLALFLKHMDSLSPGPQRIWREGKN